MAFAAGTRLGPYEVVSPIGEGGMGEVYRARDTKLDREVAIKVLPEEFANDDERLARFEREAKLLASLNHPNIASIHGFEESDGVNALVLELIEGPTLAERIREGPIPVDEAIPIAKQIAEALEAGHAAGVIHRDLKPANVKLREDGTVKVLDYGLAKALEGETTSGADSELSHSPTLTRQGTQIGVILGTAAYMSPEQAKGRTVDRRADVWAFGAVVYEMLTGTRAFAGSDVSEVLASVLAREPDWTLLPPDMSPTLGTYLRRCLHKDPKQRIPDMAAMRLAMEGAFDTVAAPSGVDERGEAGSRRVVTAALLSALTGAVLSALIVWNVRPAQDSRQVSRFSMLLSPGDRFGDINQSLVDISPDGSKVVYVANDQLYLRLTDARQASPILGTEGANTPFFSPDGRWLGFFQDDRLKKLELTSQEILTVASVDSQRGATWGADGTIVFARARGLARVSAIGGEPVQITEADPARGETIRRHPRFLPDGRSVLFEIDHPGPVGDVSEIAVLNLDTAQLDVLMVGGGSPRFIPTGHIVYAVNENFATGPAGLRAVPFDIETRRITGESTPLGVDVMLSEPLGFAAFAISENGTLISLPVDDADQALRRMVWVDRMGNHEIVPAPPRLYASPRLSPDGTRIAVVDQTQGGDVWIWDLGRRNLSRLTQDPGLDNAPLWSPDGERLVFSSARIGAGLLWKAANGTGTAETVLAERVYADAFTPDGGQLLVSSAGDIHLVSLNDDGPVVRPLVADARIQNSASLSPNGRWIAYQSNESGTTEVYVRPFPNVENDRVSISSGGGMMPLWNPNGRELHFLTLEGRLMSVPVEIGEEFEAGVPDSVWANDVDVRWSWTTLARNYDIDLDGERFLIIKSEGDEENASQARFDVVLNWYQELTERLSVR